MYRKPKLLSDFVDICRKNRYFEAIASDKLVKQIKFLTHAPKLQANIERQWLYKSKNIENSLKTYSEQDFSDCGENLTLLQKYAIVRKRDRLAKTVPFGLINILERRNQSTSLVGDGSDEKAIDIELNIGGKLLTCSYLVSDKQSQEYFYRIQRLRKIWWMKYAANPGRFLISEIKQNALNNCETQSVSIKASYPFGNLEIENIELLPIELVEPEVKLKNSKGSNSSPNKVVRTTAISEVAVIETVLDSIDAGDFGEMCLHRKLAPYQCSIFCSTEDPLILRELKELAQYITMLIQNMNVSILNSEKSHLVDKISLEKEFAEMDAIGIPYGIILEPDTLRTGFMKLRNRDTTLSETIHMSYIPQYLLKIFQ